MKAYTDYPFTELGDIAYQEAPIRECEAIAYDRNKYVRILIDGKQHEVKAGYLYPKHGRCGEVKSLSLKQLNSLPDYD